MIDLIIILFGITMLYAATAGRLESYVTVITVQGMLLFLLVLLDYGTEDMPGLLFMSFETLIVKTMAIPLFLKYIIRKNAIFREVEPHVTNFYSLIITTIIFAGGFYLSYFAFNTAGGVRPLYFGISISVLVTALFIIITRKKIITHVMGYMMMENGIYLLALSAVKRNPLIVELGILFDIVMAVCLLGILITRVQSVYAETHIDNLSKLKDE